MNKGIVFDLDGTLVDSLSVTFAAFNHGIAKLGGRPHTPHEIMNYFGTGEQQIFAAILGADKASEAYELSRAFTYENLHQVPLHPGAGELLEKAKSAGVPIAIFTGRSWNTTELILNHHRLLDRFVTVIANDHVTRPKPSCEGLLLALSRMKLQPQNVLFVGDSAADMMASREAETQGVAALWDLLANREELARHEPHHWAKHPLEIWDFLEKMPSSKQNKN